MIGGAFLRVSDVHAQVELWLTDPGGSARFEKQKPGLVFGSAGIGKHDDRNRSEQ